MPTYQYRCTECGHDLEAVQKFTDDPLTECPQCHGKLRKVYNAVGIVFKGSGFYATDSRKSQTAASTSSTPAESSKPASDAGSQAPSSSPASGTSSSAPSTGSTPSA